MCERQGYRSSFSSKPYRTYVPQFKVGTVVERDGKTRHADLTLEVGSYVQDYRPCSLHSAITSEPFFANYQATLRISIKPIGSTIHPEQFQHLLSSVG